MVINQLQKFQQAYLEHHQNEHNSLPSIEHDEQWPSPCEQGAVDENGMVLWKFHSLAEPLSFANVEKALSINVHPDIVSLFSHFYSDNLTGKTSDGALQLLQPWNKDDFERLQENIIGHVLMKQKLKQAITLFVGVTDDEDIIISVNNETGQVWAEQVGREPHKLLAESLAEFIAQIEPLSY